MFTEEVMTADLLAGQDPGLETSAEQRDEAERAGAEDFLFRSFCAMCTTSCHRYHPIVQDCLSWRDANFALGKS